MSDLDAQLATVKELQDAGDAVDVTLDYQPTDDPGADRVEETGVVTHVEPTSQYSRRDVAYIHVQTTWGPRRVMFGGKVDARDTHRALGYDASVRIGAPDEPSNDGGQSLAADGRGLTPTGYGSALLLIALLVFVLGYGLYAMTFGGWA